MLNLNDLETRWFKYKLKYYLPFFILALLMIITLSISYKLFFTTKTPSSNKEIQTTIVPKLLKKTDSNISTIQKSASLKVTILEEEKKTIARANEEQVNQSKLILQPSFKTIDNINETSFEKKITSVEKTKPVIKHSLLGKEKLVQEQSKIAKIEPSIIDKPSTKKEISADNLVQIKRQNTKNDIQHVVKRFKKTNNPALSLFIAKKYYELGDYHQAYNYAFITNEINNNIEESWLIFSKALVKLGEKEKAVSVLRKYIQGSHSQRAQVLLKNILSGKTE